MPLIDQIGDKVLRPIIFVCHSLGGLVCKQVRTPGSSGILPPEVVTNSQALLLANAPKSHYQDILSATAAVVFLGTPHQGSKIADTGKAVGNIANAFLRITQITSVTGSIRGDLVSTLSAGSGKLQALALSFQQQLDYLSIVTFYEQQFTFPLQSLVKTSLATVWL